METELRIWLQSSQDPAVIANKVRGAILAASFIIIAVAGSAFHITLTPTDVLSAATEIGTLVGAAWTVYGCILHLVTWVGTVQKGTQ